MLLTKIRQIVENKLKNFPLRLSHSLRVYRTATKLARHYRKPSLPIQIAALFHDFTKNDSFEQQKPYLTKISIIKYQKTPAIFHALSAANFLKKELGINNKIILNAIKKHVWGDIKMNYCDKIVFLSDKIEPKRNYPQRKYFEKLAYLDIHQAIYEILKNNFDYFLKKNHPLPSNYQLILESLKKDIKKKIL
ncbi:bis(5'-nucleosyl)-tetraphosphatase (symmetrical) YqeK [Candidatus Phytoplasma solani]|uniref:bis(5'-nucleosyl)-tetraphosphatase (symmetrical) n=1 Tax=Candidatus Phytoplasma solani TaxID=69896 RepID=A0A421NXJ0_9MOLU|nr:bis(5'-nucleosyl)-tetraphosphatase (symmetrical) YqeK [Candidatus Phytoplasma solani]RMI88743.1 hydrolase [Candidatus Phytoplasma solani]CCP88278.1 Predicted HD superfamily hydrolase [Candidatus Phytoplasma solani]CCP88762.1 Predicted HD superfamily hydrolase [Candidatus Phytoplasma solani]